MSNEEINKICEKIIETANKKERANRKGVCSHEVIGFVHGLRWCVSYLKSLRGNENEQ